MSDALSDEDFAEVFAVEDLAGDGSRLLLAVSGGPDSRALMHAAAHWSRKHGPPLAVATVDHGLRPESRGEAEAVGIAADAIGLPHAILAWTDRPAGPVSQESARDARYRLLMDHARAIGAARLATAHTRDDQAETVLMRLADGSGLTGLAGMASSRRRDGLLHLRPFLHLTKASLVATCRARGWGFVEDPSNADPRFARPRWRALATALAEEGLDASRITRFAGRMRRADLALESMSEAVAARLCREVDGGLHIDFAALVREPDEIVLRVVLRALKRIEPAPGESGAIRLDRVESGVAALRAHEMTDSAMRRTLAGRLLSLDRSGGLTIAPEGERRRGR